MVTPRIAALDAPSKTKSLPVIPRRTSLQQMLVIITNRENQGMGTCFRYWMDGLMELMENGF